MTQINASKSSADSIDSKNQILFNAINVITKTQDAWRSAMQLEKFLNEVEPSKNDWKVPRLSVLDRPGPTADEKAMRLSQRRQYNIRAGIVSSATANV